MNKIMNYLVPILMVIGGLVFIGLGIKNYQDQKNGVKVQAVVTKIESETRFDGDSTTIEEIYFVRYTVDGKVYEEQLQFTTTGYKEGEEIVILYDPLNPSYVIGTSKIGVPLYIGFGIAVLASGVYGTIKSVRSKGELGAGFENDEEEEDEDPDEENRHKFEGNPFE